MSSCETQLCEKTGCANLYSNYDYLSSNYFSLERKAYTSKLPTVLVNTMRTVEGSKMVANEFLETFFQVTQEQLFINVH